MDIENATWEGPEKWLFDKTHEAGEADQIDPPELRENAGAVVRPGGHDGGRDARLLGFPQDSGVRTIREDQRDPTAEGLVKCLKVGSFSRSQNRNFRHSASLKPRRTRDHRHFRKYAVLDENRARFTEGVGGFIGANSDLAITGFEFNGTSISLTDVTGLRTGATYHLEAGPTLEDFSPITGSDFTKDSASYPTVPTTAPKFSLRIAEGPVPVN